MANTQWACSGCCVGSDGVDTCSSQLGCGIQGKELGEFHIAVFLGDVAKVQWFLAHRRKLLNETDKKGRTALHWACISSHPKTVNFLVDRKFGHNIFDRLRRAAFVKAIKRQREKCVTLLLEHDAEITLKDAHGNTPLHYAACNGDLIIAAKLLSHGANIEVKNEDKNTPFLCALKRKQLKMAKFLIMENADIHAVDRSKRTALMLAVCCQSSKMVSVLLKQNIDVFAQNTLGWTAEDYALTSGSVTTLDGDDDLWDMPDVEDFYYETKIFSHTLYLVFTVVEARRGTVRTEDAAGIEDRNSDTPKGDVLKSHPSRSKKAQAFPEIAFPSPGPYSKPSLTSLSDLSLTEEGARKPATGKKETSGIGIIDSAPREPKSNDNFIFVCKNKGEPDFVVASAEEQEKLKGSESTQPQVKNQMHSMNDLDDLTWSSEIASGDFIFTLKQEEVKRRNAEILHEKMREKLMEKEAEMKHQLTQIPYDMELKTIRNYSNQISHSHEKEKDVLHENHMWQDETAKLRLEIDLINKQKQKYLKDLELLQEKYDDVQNALKQKEKLLTKTISQYSGELSTLRAENEILDSKLEKEKQNKERLSTEIESYCSRLTAAIRDRDKSETIKKDLELNFHSAVGDWCCLQENLNLQVTCLLQQLSKADSKFDSLKVELDHTRQALIEKTSALQTVQRDLSRSQCQKKEIEQMYEKEQAEMNKYVANQERIKEKLSQLQNENMLLQQQLKAAEDEADIREKTMIGIQDQFHDIIIKRQDESKKHSLLLEEKNKELIKECNNLKERQYEWWKVKTETEAQQPHDRTHAQGGQKKPKANRLDEDTTEKEQQEAIAHIYEVQDETDGLTEEDRAELKEVHNEIKWATRHAEKMQGDMKKLKIENSKLKVIIREQVNQLEQHEKNLLSIRLILTSCQEVLEHAGTTETLTELNSSYSESELSTTETSQEDVDKPIFGKHKQLYLKVLKARKLLSNELSIAHDPLLEARTRLLAEKQNSRSSSASLTATPCVKNVKESLLSTESLPRGKTVIPASSPRDFKYKPG
ncbi:PREDICTED: ankyrin repeat domain-containing protein 30A-like [Propithecus coquereli]|uniref:ankyrin repeat domain-containing protein 30A-like n=1 Tax=Propithecus coquereli TaxID=379532 RepID=UPI00063FAFC3|nr:PREDICTED: ankyrin repeat domain-containing protein 30A-like [Propithecus coquereli]